MYADDTHITLTSSNIYVLLTNANKELRNISEWMRVSKLSENPDKTEYMIIGHPRRTNKVEISQQLHLNDSEIKRVTKTKSLGVIVRKPYRAAALFAHLHRQLRCSDGSLPCCFI